MLLINWERSKKGYGEKEIEASFADVCSSSLLPLHPFFLCREKNAIFYQHDSFPLKINSLPILYLKSVVRRFFSSNWWDLVFPTSFLTLFQVSLCIRPLGWTINCEITRVWRPNACLRMGGSVGHSPVFQSALQSLLGELGRCAHGDLISVILCVYCGVERCLLITVSAGGQHLAKILHKLSLWERIFT